MAVSPRRVSSVSIGLENTLEMTNMLMNRDSGPFGRSRRRRASLTAFVGNMHSPKPSDDNMMSSSCHGTSARRSSMAVDTSKATSRLATSGNALDMDASLSGIGNRKKKAIRRATSFQHSSVSLDHGAALDNHAHLAASDDDMDEKLRALSVRKSSRRSPTRKNSSSSTIVKEKAEDEQRGHDSEHPNHFHDDSCANASGSCPHERTSSKSSTKKDKKSRRGSKGTPVATNSLTRVRRVASNNDIMDQSSDGTNQDTTCRRSKSGSKLSSSSRKSGNENSSQVNRSWSSSSKKKSSSGTKDRLMSPNRSSSSGRSGLNLSSSRHGKRSPTGSNAKATPRQQRNSAATRAKAAATALLVTSPALEDDDTVQGSTSVDAAIHSAQSPPPPPRRHNPAETWICECGYELRLCMKFCGMCARPQNWVCGKCQFGENIQCFRFCGGCAAPRKLEKPHRSQCGNNSDASNGDVDAPTSPMSVADLGED
ncbi:expressed unknown protein [Seminavis robusta]|uniref:Uncharacterized protein n=1 Tax=Seminavis robusta TaxID=568900 RepID=A0A9N8D7E8_9STRA|nr:expressed unknown protein [Seminavis robusta]|eukprot:Sro24_g016660.1 n/a (482) ;mRNA; f:171640-173204